MCRVSILCIFALAATAAHAQGGRERAWSMQREGLGSWQQRNRVESPNTAGAKRFSLDEVAGDGSFAGARLEVFLPIRERQDVLPPVAPLTVREDGSLPQAVRFEDTRFVAGRANAGYCFDSCRVGWRSVNRPAARASRS